MDATQETQEAQSGGAFSPQGLSQGSGTASSGGGGGPTYLPGAGASGAGAAPLMSHFGEGGGGGGSTGGQPGGGGGGPAGPGWNFDAAWSGLGGGGGKKRGAPLAQTLAMGNKAPKGKFADAPAVGDKKGEEAAGKTSGDVTGDKGGDKPGDKTAPKPGADKSGGHAKDDDQKNGTAPKAGEKTELPADVKAAFSGGDLENVAVYLHSPEAAKKGVKGFANINEIHVAPGADEKIVLRHEAAHVIQFRKGRDNLAKGQKPDTKSENEKHAEAAEKSGQTEAKDLGSADPDSVRFSGEGGGGSTEGNSTNANSSGVPKVTFNGTQFDSLQGEFSGDLAKAKWGKTNLFQKEMWWRIPAFPAAGLYVKASGQFEPGASIGWKGTYSYSASSRKFTIGGSISGSLSAAITFALEGGAGINLVVQSGGVGIEAAATLSASASASRSISAWIDTDGNCGLDVVPIEVDFGAVLKAALSLVLWTDGWFYSDKWKWTFAEWTIATLAQYKANISVGLSSKDGVKTNIGPVQEGVFTWGQAPPAEQGNGQKQ